MVDGRFCSKILGPWWGPTMTFCSYVNADGVGIVLAGGGDTTICGNQNFLCSQVVGTLKPSLK